MIGVDATRSFSGDEVLERVTGLNGVRPMARFVEIAGLVDNS
jgi:hypothetical protein